MFDLYLLSLYFGLGVSSTLRVELHHTKLPTCGKRSLKAQGVLFASVVGPSPPALTALSPVVVVAVVSGGGGGGGGGDRAVAPPGVRCMQH